MLRTQLHLLSQKMATSFAVNRFNKAKRSRNWPENCYNKDDRQGWSELHSSDPRRGAVPIYNRSDARPAKCDNGHGHGICPVMTAGEAQPQSAFHVIPPHGKLRDARDTQYADRGNPATRCGTISPRTWRTGNHAICRHGWSLVEDLGCGYCLGSSPSGHRCRSGTAGRTRLG
jgi:hypothetical protein